MTDGRTAQLRAMLQADGMVTAPFCLNALHAKIAESVGFGAVYMTGSGTSAEKGFADVGLLTQTEMVANARYIANAVDVPVVADCDTGYGNAINVWRSVREYESIGVSGIHIEDQVFPKKCGFFAGKDVIPHGGARPEGASRPRRPPRLRLRHHREDRRARGQRLGGHSPPLPRLPRRRCGPRVRGRSEDQRGPADIRHLRTFPRSSTAPTPSPRRAR